MSILSSLGSFFSSIGNAAKTWTENNIIKIFEYLFLQMMNYIFLFITDVITYMVNIFFDFAYSFQASTAFLGVVGFPVFIIGFAVVGGVVYLIFRVIEGFL